MAHFASPSPTTTSSNCGIADDSHRSRSRRQVMKPPPGVSVATWVASLTAAERAKLNEQLRHEDRALNEAINAFRSVPRRRRRVR